MAGVKPHARGPGEASLLHNPLHHPSHHPSHRPLLHPSLQGLLFRWFLLSLFIGVCVVQILSVRLGDSPRLITSDARGYYVWARSLILDRDLQFRNDYELVYPPDPLPPEHRSPTPRVDAANKYPVGLALIEAPALLIAHLAALALPSYPADGVSLPYQLGVSLYLAACAIGGLALLCAAMVRVGVPMGLAALLIALMVLGTNLIHYIAKEPAMAHASGVAVTCVLIYLLAGRPARAASRSWRGRFLVGLLLGLLMLIRNSNAALLPFLGLLIVKKWGADRRLLLIPLAAILVLALQPLSLYLLWGDFRLNTYAGERFTGAPEGFFRSLFDARHGLFLYHPYYLALLLIVAIGAIRPSKHRPIAIAALVSFLCLLAINGSWWCWWFGHAYGNRGFIETLPVLTMGAGLVLSQMRARRVAVRTAAAAVTLMCLLNLWLWAGYLLQRYPPDGSHTVGEAYLWVLGEGRFAP